MQFGVVPDCCRRIRVGQGGTSQAKQGKQPMSTPTAPFLLQQRFCRLCRLSWTYRCGPEGIARLFNHYYWKESILFKIPSIPLAPKKKAAALKIAGSFFS
jgi:hypothetical protein